MVMSKVFRKTFFLLIIIAINSAACANRQTTIHLPPPDSKCKVELDWHGLKPGQSTRQDVEEALGMPFEKGILRSDDRNISYYAYKVEGGEISKYAFDRIFFRPDGLIDWMEIIEADRNGNFHTVFDIAKLLGNKIDTIYSNNNYRPQNNFPDVLAGPDRIYVWSECGLVLDALPSTYSQAFQAGKTECKSDNNEELCNLVPQYPSPYNVGRNPQPDINSVILMKFYFQPTSYEGFTQHYIYKIPYGLWKEYLAENR